MDFVNHWVPPKGDYYYTFMGGEAKWLKFDKNALILIIINQAFVEFKWLACSLPTRETGVRARRIPQNAWF